jgi:hypothetical protein
MIRTRFFAFPLVGALALVILSGCATDAFSNIPGNATIASSGDDHLSFTAQTSGTVWVFDVNNDRIDYSGPVAANDSVTVDPGSNSIKVNGQVVTDKLDKNSKHRIYYVAGQQTQAQGS